MPWIISEFHELNLPRPDNITRIVDRKDWCVHSTHNSLYYLLNDGNYDIADLSAGLNHREFYFDTEEECHEQAAEYYWKHGRTYPYVKAWADCVAGAIDDSVPDDTASRVMEFI